MYGGGGGSRGEGLVVVTQPRHATAPFSFHCDHGASDMLSTLFDLTRADLIQSDLFSLGTFKFEFLLISAAR